MAFYDPSRFEADPEQSSRFAEDLTMQRAAFNTSLQGLGGGILGLLGRLRGFGRLQPQSNIASVREALATRQGASQARVAQQNETLEDLLRRLGGRYHGTRGPGPQPPVTEATARVGRSPVGRPDLPSEELMPSIESPGGRGFSRLRP